VKIYRDVLRINTKKHLPANNLVCQPSEGPSGRGSDNTLNNIYIRLLLANPLICGDSAILNG